MMGASPGARARPTSRRHRDSTAVAVTDSRSAKAWPWALAASLAAMLWSYWPTIVSLAGEWNRNQDYSVGQLVPLAAVYLVWHDRSKLRRCVVQPSGWGVALILLAQLARACGVLFLYESAERYSLVLTAAGVVLLVLGWKTFRQLAWILAFLLLMVPLPGRIHGMISGPMQTQATGGAVVLLELLGVTVARDGNVILLNNTTQLAVAEACSGLRMLTSFVMVAAVLAYLVHRPRWQKMVVLVSSVPIAIVCNLARLFATAELYMVTSSESAERFFHDCAGLVMMPLAVLILAGELWLMNRLVIPEISPGATEPPVRAVGRL